MFQPQDVLPHRRDDHLSPEQDAIGLSLRRYYHFTCVGPIPERLRILLVEMERRAEAIESR